MKTKRKPLGMKNEEQKAIPRVAKSRSAVGEQQSAPLLCDSVNTYLTMLWSQAILTATLK